jgi:lipid A ethanolaminephosphotransferase
MQFFSKKISQVNLVLFVGAFLTLTGNFTFFEKTMQIYQFSENWLFIASLFLFLFSFLAIILLLFCFRWTTKPILIFLLVVSSVLTYIIQNYGIVFDHNMITNTFETDTSELSDLLSIQFIIYLFLLGLIPSFIVWKVKILKLPFKTQFWQRIKVLVTLIVIFVVVILSFSKHYTSFARENRDLRLYITPSYFIYSSLKFVDSKIETSAKPFKVIGQDAVINKKSDKRRLVIFVIGEAARRDHMSINGYDLLTNPILEKEDLISFNNMTSCGTDTAWSVPCMFSLLGRESYSHAKGKNMSNVLDLVSQAGASVLWLENNSSSKSVADRVDFVDYRTGVNNPICNPECRDEGMLVNLQNYVDKRDGDILIVMHTMGSHGPAYYQRYPKEFEVFKPICETNQLNECSDTEITNAYDNTILYTDYFLSKVIEFLKRNSQIYDTAMFYVSDHGESLGEGGLYLHGMPYFMAPDEQINVAAFMWFDDSMSKLFDKKIIREIANLPQTHDSLFHTILGLMDVETDLYEKDLDLTTN